MGGSGGVFDGAGCVRVGWGDGCTGDSGFVLGGVCAAHLFFDLSLARRSQLLKGGTLRLSLPPDFAALHQKAAMTFALGDCPTFAFASLRQRRENHLRRKAPWLRRWAEMMVIA